MPGIRIVLDTNVLVSGLAYPSSIPGRILGLWRQGGVDVVLSRYILDELLHVLPRLTRINFTQDEMRDLVDSFLFLADIVEPDILHEASLRDLADQPILATLRAANAKFLVTGDKDLLALASTYPILTPAAFWSRHS